MLANCYYKYILHISAIYHSITHSPKKYTDTKLANSSDKFPFFLSSFLFLILILKHILEESLPDSIPPSSISSAT